MLKKLKEKLLLLEYSKNNYEIILEEDDKLRIDLIYSISEDQVRVYKEYIDKNLIREYIRIFSFRVI